MKNFENSSEQLFSIFILWNFCTSASIISKLFENFPGHYLPETLMSDNEWQSGQWGTIDI